MVPGPAARIAVSPEVSRLVVGQRIRLAGRAYSKAGDEREDDIAWRSSAAATARVTNDGVVTALAPGRAVITASAGGVNEAVELQVVANTIASIELTPNRVEAKEGCARRSLCWHVGGSVGGPAWTRTTDLYIISVAL